MLFQPAVAAAASASSLHGMAAAALMEQNKSSPPQASSRILYDIPCKVCTDHSSGKHYGIFACDGCAGFFKRSIRRNRQYVCKSKSEGGCTVDKTHRNQCRSCRLKRCLDVGMNKEAVQHERGPRNSTLRRQMSMFFKEHHALVHHGGSATPPALSAPPTAPASSSPVSHSPDSTPPPTSAQTILPAFSSSSASPPLNMQTSPSPSPIKHRPQLMVPTPATSTVSSPSVIPPPQYPFPPPPPFFLDPRLAAAAALGSQLGLPPPLLSSPYSLNSVAAGASYRPGGLLMPTPKYPSPDLRHNISPLHHPPSPALAAAAMAQVQQQQQASSPPRQLPPPPPTFEHISETAARLLFMNVRWAQHVPAFTSLPYRDQMTLLEETWRELFVLSAAQFSLPVELAAVSSVDPSVAVLTELKALQDAIRKFQAMGVDPTEYACLRAIILLKTTLDSSHSPGGKSSSSNSSPNGGRSGANAEAMPVKELRDQAAINALQDQAHSTLSKYIASTYPNQPTRFGKLLLLLPALKTVSAKGIEEVFFKRTIGTIPLEKIICDMFKAGAV